MKIKLLLSIATLFFVCLFGIPSYAQSQMISISNLKYTNGSAIASGSPIQIASGKSVSVTFDLSINNPQMAFIKGGILTVYSKFDNNSNLQHVAITFGQNAITGSVTRQCTIELRSTHFPSGTGSIYAQFLPIGNGPVSGSTVPVKVVPLITSNYILGNQTIYEGDIPYRISGSVSLGGDGLYTYSWQKRIGNSSWTTIPGATSKDFSPTDSFVSTIAYRRIVESLFGTISNTSDEVTVTILPNIPIQNNTITISGSDIQGSTPSGGIGTYTYIWYTYILEGEGWQMMQYTTKDWNVPANIYLFMDNIGAAQGLVYREVRSGNKSSSSNVVTIFPAQQIDNNFINLSGQTITGTTPTGGNGSFKYEYYMTQEYDGEILDTNMVGSDKDYTISSYGALTTKIYRRVVSANKTSVSNTILIPPSASFAKKAFTNTEANSSELAVYPNPTSEAVNFSTNFSTNKEIEIVIYSEKLRAEKSVFRGTVTPNQVVNWNIPSSYQKGLYFYKILSGSKEVKTGKIIVQ